jgi:hypothetical protein
MDELRVLLAGWITEAPTEGMVLPDVAAVSRAAQWAVDAARVAGSTDGCERAAAALSKAARRIGDNRGEMAREIKPDGKRIKRAAAAKAQAAADALQAHADRLRGARAHLGAATTS